MLIKEIRVACLVAAALLVALTQSGFAQEGRDAELKQFANQLEEKMKKYQAQLKEVNGALEQLKGGKKSEAKAKQLRAHQKELNQAIQRGKNQFVEIRAHFANREREQERGSRERGERKERGERGERREQGEQEENAEIRRARDQLKHLKQAQGHLREAGMKELAQAVGQRMERIAGALNRNNERQRAERSEKRVRTERTERTEREGGDRARADENFRKEIIGAIRELGSAVRSLRKEVDELKKRR